MAALVGCNRDAADASKTDADEVIQLALTMARSEREGACVVRNVKSDPDLDTTEGWQLLEGIRYRHVPSPSVVVITDKVGSGWKFTSDDFGCADTLRVWQPEFFEVGQPHSTRLQANLKLDHLCGPICGEQYNLGFHKERGSWKPDTSKTPSA